MAAKRKPAPKKARAAAPVPGPDPARVEIVLRLRLDGAQLHDLAAFANERDPDGKADAARGGPPWDATEAELAELADRADALIVARAETKRERAYALAVARREALYARAVNAGDYSAALATLKDIAQLQGTYPKVADLVRLVKEQDATIKELEADRDRPQLGPAEDRPEAGGDGPGQAVAGEGGDPVPGQVGG